MNKIEKVLDIDDSNFKWVQNFFENHSENKNLFGDNILNFIVYKNNPKLFVDKLEDTPFKKFKSDELIEKIYLCVKHLCEVFNIKQLWLMVYPPKTHLNFHVDHEKNRHVISFFNDERFFNYESYSTNLHELSIIYNKKLSEPNFNIDEFNTYFLNSHKNNKIISFDANSVYKFGNTLHTFYNGSDKLRINFVFEVI